MIADAVKIDLKVLAAARSPVPLERAIPVFHRWIQERSLDELMVDVADYTPVSYTHLTLPTILRV